MTATPRRAAPQRRRVRIPETDVEIAVLDWGGDGPVALLCHANGFCGALWQEVAELLAPHFRVVAMDARGHGDSTCPRPEAPFDWNVLASDVIAVAESLLAVTGRERIALGIGHSFGGALSLTAAARRPRLYERLLLVDPVILPPASERQGFGDGKGSGLAERARKRRHEWPSRDAARAFFREKELFADWRPEAVGIYVREALRERSDGSVELKCSGDVEAAVFEGAPSLDTFALAAQVSAPVLLLRATRGDHPRVFYERLVRSLPDAALQDVDAGHLVPMEAPAAVADAALAFAGVAANH